MKYKGTMAHEGWWHRARSLRIEFCGPKIGDSECLFNITLVKILISSGGGLEKFLGGVH